MGATGWSVNGPSAVSPPNSSMSLSHVPVLKPPTQPTRPAHLPHIYLSTSPATHHSPPPSAVRLSPEEWTPGGDGNGGGGRGGGLLTPTHKLVRHCLRRRFAAEVAEMAVEVA